jgi:hypothetical protein
VHAIPLASSYFMALLDTLSASPLQAATPSCAVPCTLRAHPSTLWSWKCTSRFLGTVLRLIPG